LIQLQAVNFPTISSHERHSGLESEQLKSTMASLGGPKQPSGDWELFLKMWERANSVRAFFWTQRVNDEKLLLTHFLPRLRRFFAVDVSFGALSVSEETLVEVGVPEAGMTQLPPDFSRRCLESVANSKAPVTWNEAGIGLGFRSTVVVPLRAPTGPAFGFLLLGHARARSYSALELFLLQALAGELSWVARDLAARKSQEQKLAAAARGIKSALEAIKSNTAQGRRKIKDHLGSDADKHLEAVEAAAEHVAEYTRVLPASSTSDANPSQRGETVADIATLVTQSASLCRAAKERGIDVEVVYAPEASNSGSVIPERVKGFLSALVDNAASATRNETVRFTVRRDGRDLEVVVKGMGSSRVADTLKSTFEAAARLEGARDENGEAIVRVREYLDNAGGDVYLKNRPGESAEFVVRLPIDSGAHAGGERLQDVDTEQLA
jgi:signal transduction histidine kinase